MPRYFACPSSHLNGQGTNKYYRKRFDNSRSNALQSSLIPDLMSCLSSKLVRRCSAASTVCIMQSLGCLYLLGGIFSMLNDYV